MKNSLITACLRVAALCWLNFVLSPAAYCKEQVWVLEQKDHRLGLQTVYIAKNAVRISNTMPRYDIIATAPAWHAVIISPPNKRFFDRTPSDWHRHGFNFDPFPSVFEEVRGMLKPSRKIEYESHPAIVYSANSLHMIMPSDFTLDNKVKKQISEMSITCSEEIVCDQEIRILLDHYHRLPVLEHVPLAASYRLSTGVREAKLITTAIKRVDAAKVSFVPPTGYKRAASGVETVLSPAEQKGIDNWVEDMGLGVPLGK